MKKNKLDLLNNININTDTQEGKRYLFIDGLNLFFRNFAILNFINPQGVHVGGLGGFFRSLGSLINKIEPTDVYVIFDGVESSTSRKNLIPEYKSGRNLTRITNWEVFDSLEEEGDSKIDQIVRIIHYLKHLPVKTLALNKVEADDVIAHLCSHLTTDPETQCFIVSSDKDYLQLVSDNLIVYRPMEKEYYNLNMFKQKYDIIPENYIIYKTLIGDTSDKITGVKGMGKGKIYKLFPELQTKKLTLDDIYNISKEKLKENILYARIVQNYKQLERYFLIMDLSKPMLSEEDIEYINSTLETPPPQLNEDVFLAMYEEDGLGGIIRNTNHWLKENFTHLNKQ